MGEEEKGSMFRRVRDGLASGKRKERQEFPPALKWSEVCFLWASSVGAVVALIFVIEQFCSAHPLAWLVKGLWSCEISLSCVWGTYVAFGAIFTALLVHHWIYHKRKVHFGRLEDISEVEATFVEVRTVEPRLNKPEKPDRYKEKKKQLEGEVSRLQELGRDGWTEYQVLSVNQMLVDFLKIDELEARARSCLDDLQEYADDRYDRRHYEEWKRRIDGAIEMAKKGGDEKVRDASAEKLRGELRTLLEHVADYERYWVEGSVFIRALSLVGVCVIPVTLGMGLLPILHPAGNDLLGIVNWGFLGIAGAMTAVLLSLRKSDVVEVGTTRGKRELWRAILGGALGLVAGILLYAMIAGGVLAGSAFPSFESIAGLDKEKVELQNVARSIFWGIAAGFSFEWVFDRVRSATQEGELGASEGTES